MSDRDTYRANEKVPPARNTPAGEDEMTIRNPDDVARLAEARALLEWISTYGAAFPSAIEIGPYGERPTDEPDGEEWMERVRAFLAKGTPEQ